MPPRQITPEEYDRLASRVTSMEARAPQTPSVDFDISKTLTNLTRQSFENIIKSNFFPADAFASFAKDFNTMENAVMKVAQGFGGSRDMAVQLKKTIDMATPSVMALGGSIEDVVNMQKGVMESLNRQVILDEKSYADLYAVQSLISGGQKASAESTAKLVSQFKDLGYSIYDITKQMGGVINMSRDMGVATQAVYSQLSENIGRLNLYNFENGIQGMAKMAAEAASLRLNMSDTFDFAEKVFKPEDAMAMAANMQRLGINVSNLLDPFKLMDMAQNRPEELQKSLMQAAREFVRFDEAQGKFVVSDTRRMRDFADTIGKSAGEVAKMGINFADMQRKLEKIDFGQHIVSEEDKKFFAGLAELKGDKYVVNVALEGQKPILKELNQLKQEEIDNFKRDQKDKEKTPAQLQLESLNALKRIELRLGAMGGVLPRHLAASETLDKGIEKIGGGAESIVDAVMSKMGMEMKDGRLDISKTAKALDDMGANITTSLSEIMQDPEKGITSLLSKLGSGLIQFTSDLTDASTYTNFINDILTKAEEDSAKKGENIKFTELLNNFGNLSGLFSPAAASASVSGTPPTGTSSSTPPPTGGATSAPPAGTSSSTPPPTGGATSAPPAGTIVPPAAGSNNSFNPNIITPQTIYMVLDGITQNAAAPLTAVMYQSFEKALEYYASSPALSVSLWGDNIGLTEGVKKVKEGIDKTNESHKNKSEKEKTIATQDKTKKSDETKPPTPQSKVTTNTNVTNYGDVLNAMAQGKVSETIMAQGKLSESTIKILEKNKETKESNSFVNEKLIDKKFNEKFGIIEKEKGITPNMKDEDRENLIKPYLQKNDNLIRMNNEASSQLKPTIENINKFTNTSINLLSLKSESDKKLPFISPLIDNTKTSVTSPIITDNLKPESEIKIPYRLPEPTDMGMEGTKMNAEKTSTTLEKSNSLVKEAYKEMVEREKSQTTNFLLTERQKPTLLSPKPRTASVKMNMPAAVQLPSTGLNTNTVSKTEHQFGDVNMNLKIGLEGGENEFSRLLVESMKMNPTVRRNLENLVSDKVGDMTTGPKGQSTIKTYRS